MSTCIVFEYPRSYLKYPGRQQGDMKQFLHRRPTNIRHRRVKFSHRGVVLRGLFAPLSFCVPTCLSVSPCVCRSVCLCVRNKCKVCCIYFCKFHTFGIFHLFCRKMSFDYSVACLSTHSSHISTHSVMYSHLSAEPVTCHSECTVAHHVLQSRAPQARCRTWSRCCANHVCVQ